MKYLWLLISLCLLSACYPYKVKRSQNIVYDQKQDLLLDVYSPKNATQPKEVLVFIHGGNWVHGKKSIYKFFGRGFARKGIVTVVINYRKDKVATYDILAARSAMAVKWVKDHITDYGGDTSKIFVSGHSAGGHLAALIAMDTGYFNSLKTANPVKGIILIDAFGLDMDTYLSRSVNTKDTLYYNVFTSRPANWKKGSPVTYLNKTTPPFLTFLGSKTYPAIKTGTSNFMELLQPYQPNAKLILVKGRRHAGMIFQFLGAHNAAYKEIIDFIHLPLK
jgi:dipeptidyl aminopeptidase/acylaminoacyl peptidase